MRHILNSLILAASVAAAQTPITLADLEKMALERNPTIAQAQTDVKIAAARAQQAGLYPNPTLSAVGEHIATGPIIRGGEFGGEIGRAHV